MAVGYHMVSQQGDALTWEMQVEPVTMPLGRHLQRQHDPAAYTLIPALEWLQSSGRLSGFGTQLLSELEETQAQGTSPPPPE